jgi:hypothetical protein
MKTAQEVKKFTLAGKAFLTLVSKKTGSRFTYRVRNSRDNPNVKFVGVQTGSSNLHYDYVGYLHGTTFKTSEKAKVSPTSIEFRAFQFFCDSVLNQEVLPSTLECLHSNKCGRCARPLTTPESIARGIGPECWNKV